MVKLCQTESAQNSWENTKFNFGFRRMESMGKLDVWKDFKKTSNGPIELFSPLDFDLTNVNPSVSSVGYDYYQLLLKKDKTDFSREC
jgi:hypothetical protein